MSEYKRLTKRDDNGRVFIMSDKFSQIMDRLADLEDKIENGTLVELPCKVGDTVYWSVLLGTDNEEVLKGKIRGLSISENGTYWFSVVYENGLTFEHTFKEEWNKNVFLDKSQAEARLKELKGEKV